MYSSPLMTDRSEQTLASQAMVHGAVMNGMPIAANFVGLNGQDRAVAGRPEGGNQGGGKGNGGKEWKCRLSAIFQLFLPPGGKGGRGGEQGQGQGRDQ